MIPEIGHFAFILASLLCLFTTMMPILVRNSIQQWAWQKMAVALIGAFTLLSALSLIFSFLTNDYSVAYVANNSNSSLAWPYKIAAFWGGHEGSFLFWSLSICCCLVCIAFSKRLDVSFSRRIVSILSAITAGFNLVILFSSNPFARLLPNIPAEGRDLNPLLQDIGLILHPPLIFLGYTGFVVLFAGAAALLWQGEKVQQYRAWLRHWTLLTFIALTGGNAIGSWWAYHELGWGGWWFWDPVENASFIPWLIATAMLHLLLLNQRHKALGGSILILAICGYALSMIGTFLVRSGIIESVHAFASDPSRGFAILCLLFFTVGPAMLVFAYKGLPTSQAAPLTGKSGLTLYGAILILVGCFAVVLGTCYPILFKVLDLGTISVGPPYFNTLFVPITYACALIAAFALLPQLNRKMALILTALSTVTTALAYGLWPNDAWYWVLPAFFCSSALLYALAFTAFHWIKTGASGKKWGAWLAHGALACAILAATTVSNYEENAMVRMGPGMGRIVAEHTVIYEQTQQIRTDDYAATQANLRVENEDGEQLTMLYPQRRTYLDDMTELTESALYRRLTGDLYLSMGPELEQGEYLIRISFKPGINMLWLAALLMFVGAILTLGREKPLQ